MVNSEQGRKWSGQAMVRLTTCSNIEVKSHLLEMGVAREWLMSVCGPEGECNEADVL